MTELKRARTHLRKCQVLLANSRRVWAKDDSTASWRRWNEETVLAALSWVWEAQEEERTAPEKILAALEALDDRDAAEIEMLPIADIKDQLAESGWPASVPATLVALITNQADGGR